MPVIDRALVIQAEIQQGMSQSQLTPPSPTPSAEAKAVAREWEQMLKELDVDSLAPREALQWLYRLQDFVK